MESKTKKRGNEKGPTSAHVSSQIRKARQALGLDLEALAERLKDNEWPIPVSALSRLENGDRRIDVDDLIALAIALETSPTSLLLPDSGDIEPVDVSGAKDPIAANVLWLWALCEEPLDLPAIPESTKAERAVNLFKLVNKPDISPRSLTVAGFQGVKSNLVEDIPELAKVQRITLHG